MSQDLLDWIRAELIKVQPAALEAVDPVLRRARQTWGGETVYVRNRESTRPTRRTIQRREAAARPVLS